MPRLRLPAHLRALNPDLAGRDVSLAGRAKYGNRRVELDGYTFDSAAEARRYGALQALVLAGQISALEVHPSYQIAVNGQPICRYIADFRYVENGITVVEDVKSVPTRTRLYKVKRRLMRAVHGIEIKEVE